MIFHICVLLKSIGVGGSVLSICTEFLSDSWQFVLVEGAASEWISIISGVPQLGKCVGSFSVYPILKRNVWAGWEQTICLCSWLHTTGRPAVTASSKRDLAVIQRWCNHWWEIQNPNKTKALVVSRSKTVSPQHGDLVLSGDLSELVPTLTSFV